MATNESAAQQPHTTSAGVAQTAPQAATQTVAVQQTPSDKAIATINKYISGGLVLPSNYNHINAIKSSMMTIAEMKDKNGKCPLETCTPMSIQTALVDMAQKGLDVSKGQGYFSVRGNRLVFGKEYHGITTQIQRIFPNYTPIPRVVYQGDDFEFDTDQTNGRRRLVKHTQKVENMDNDFLCAYLYIPCRDGGQDLYIMTKKMILKAWDKSSSNSKQTHNDFPYKMICKTIINSALAPLVSSSDSFADANTPNGTMVETAEEERDYVVTEEANATVVNTEEVEYEEVEEQPY